MKYVIAYVLAHGIAFLITMNMAHADWFCSDQASERRGNSIVACGTGPDSASAFDQAKREFMRLCSLSEDCRSRAVKVIPRRQEIKHKQYIRLVEFELGDELSPSELTERHQAEFSAAFNALNEQLRF